MKYVVYAGHHKDFSGLRLGVRLAQNLAWNGNDVILAGPKGKLPDYTGLHTMEFATTATAKKMAEILKKEGVEKVLSLACLPICEAAVQNKIPFVYGEPENFKEEKTVKNKKTLLKKAKKVVVLAKTDKPLDKKTYGPNAVRVTGPAVWVEHFSHPHPACFKKENNLLAAGKLTKTGGFDVLLKAWAELSALHPSWHLTVVGDGPSKTSLKKFIEKNNLSASTEIVPAATNLYGLMSHADIYVNPTREGEGLDELLDAMASKLPAIATRTKAAAALMQHGINGVLVEKEDVKGLTDALDELMVNWGKRVGLAVEAARLRERYPFEVFMAFFEQDA